MLLHNVEVGIQIRHGKSLASIYVGDYVFFVVGLLNQYLTSHAFYYLNRVATSCLSPHVYPIAECTLQLGGRIQLHLRCLHFVSKHTECRIFKRVLFEIGAQAHKKCRLFYHADHLDQPRCAFTVTYSVKDVLSVARRLTNRLNWVRSVSLIGAQTPKRFILHYTLGKSKTFKSLCPTHTHG